MKVALLMENGKASLVLTPEGKFEMGMVEPFLIHPVAVSVRKGQVFTTEEEWYNYAKMFTDFQSHRIPASAPPLGSITLELVPMTIVKQEDEVGG